MSAAQRGESAGVLGRMLGVFAGALLVFFAGGSAQAGAPSRVPGCDSRWGVENTWCVGVRPGHVVVTLSPAMVGWVKVYRGSAITDQQPVASVERLRSMDDPVSWESPGLRPGVYFVETWAFPELCVYGPGGCIAIVYFLDGVIRVPAANIARHTAQIKRPKVP